MALHLRAAGACGLDCVFCSFPDRRLRFDLAALLRKARRSGERRVQVSGGEPLLIPAPKLLALLTWLKVNGYEVELQTNAVAVPSMPQEPFRRLGVLVDEFNVNFSAPDPATDLAVTRAPGAFALREEGVRLLCRLGRPVRLTYVLCAANLEAVRRFPAYVASRLPGVSWLQFSLAKGMGRAARRPGLVPSYQEASGPLVEALRSCRALRLRAEVDHIPMCFLPGFERQHVDHGKVSRRLAGVHLSEKERLPECAACALPCPGPRKDHGRDALR